MNSTLIQIPLKHYVVVIPEPFMFLLILGFIFVLIAIYVSVIFKVEGLN